MKHMVIVYLNLRRQGEAAGFADQHIFADLPVSAVLAFTDQKFNLFFAAHLQPPEFFFYFAHKVGESSRGDNAGLPAQIPID